MSPKQKNFNAQNMPDTECINRMHKKLKDAQECKSLMKRLVSLHAIDTEYQYLIDNLSDIEIAKNLNVILDKYLESNSVDKTSLGFKLLYNALAEKANFLNKGTKVNRLYQLYEIKTRPVTQENTVHSIDVEPTNKSSTCKLKKPVVNKEIVRQAKEHPSLIWRDLNSGCSTCDEWFKEAQAIHQLSPKATLMLFRSILEKVIRDFCFYLREHEVLPKSELNINNTFLLNLCKHIFDETFSLEVYSLWAELSSYTHVIHPVLKKNDEETTKLVLGYRDTLWEIVDVVSSHKNSMLLKILIEKNKELMAMKNTVQELSEQVQTLQAQIKTACHNNPAKDCQCTCHEETEHLNVQTICTNPILSLTNKEDINDDSITLEAEVAEQSDAQESCQDDFLSEMTNEVLSNLEETVEPTVQLTESQVQKEDSKKLSKLDQFFLKIENNNHIKETTTPPRNVAIQLKNKINRENNAKKR
ncbi:hypothetical protein [Ureaplasma ceti]|uniref:Uncharacterized protein n=1 Tax=Ureaplasma ceti TaxID=3119530 RepID=A0ABP9U690_9BACT